MPLYFQYDCGETGLNLYAVIRPQGLLTIWNGSAFVTYNALNWTSYDIALAEQGAGTYFGEWPSSFAAGYYIVTIYRRIGGSPATTDTYLTSQSLYFTSGEAAAPASMVPAVEFVVPASDSTNPDCDPKTVRPSDLSRVAFNVGNLPQVAGGATISTCVITSSPSGLTLSDQAIGSARGFVTVTGGTSGTDYTLTAAISLNDGSAVNPNGVLRVR